MELFGLIILMLIKFCYYLNMITIQINNDNADNLQIFKEILKKDENSIINEALEEYFASQHKKLLEKNIEDENALTNLDYDEFWDGVDL